MQPVEHSGQWRKARKLVNTPNWGRQCTPEKPKFLRTTAETGKDSNNTSVSGEAESSHLNLVADAESPSLSTSINNSQYNLLLDDRRTVHPALIDTVTNPSSDKDKQCLGWPGTRSEKQHIGKTWQATFTISWLPSNWQCMVQLITCYLLFLTL